MTHKIDPPGASRAAESPGPETPDIALRLEAALARLPARRRAIFLAVCCEARSYNEVAERLGLGVPHIEREIAAALLQLDRALDARFVDAPWWRRWFGWIARQD